MKHNKKHRIATFSDYISLQIRYSEGLLFQKEHKVGLVIHNPNKQKTYAFVITNFMVYSE